MPLLTTLLPLFAVFGMLKTRQAEVLVGLLHSKHNYCKINQFFSLKPRWDNGEIEINDMRLTLQPIPAPPQLAEEQTLLQWRTTSIESGSSLLRRPKKVAMGRCQSLVGGCYYS